MCLGVPGKIVAITDHEKQMAKVDVSGIQREVNIACVINQNAPLDHYLGEWVLVHVGFAMSLIDEDEALKTLAILAEIGEIEEELDAIKNSEG